MLIGLKSPDDRTVPPSGRLAGCHAPGDPGKFGADPGARSAVAVSQYSGGAAVLWNGGVDCVAGSRDVGLLVAVPFCQIDAASAAISRQQLGCRLDTPLRKHLLGAARCGAAQEYGLRFE